MQNLIYKEFFLNLLKYYFIYKNEIINGIPITINV